MENSNGNTAYETNYFYMRPPKEVFDIVHPDNYIFKRDKNKKIKRAIFAHVPLEEEEKNMINTLKKYVQDNKIKLAPWWNDLEYLKRTHVGKLVQKECIKALNLHVGYLEKYGKSTTIPEASRKMLLDGAIYLAGRDPQFRPIIVMDAPKLIFMKTDAHIEMFSHATNLFNSVVIEHMLVPYHVENWVVIIDVAELFVLGLPQKVIKAVGEIASVHFPGHMEKLYIVNSSRSLDMLWKVVTMVVDPEIIEKTCVLRKKDMNKMTSVLTPACLEKKFGGNIENITHYWPPDPKNFKGAPITLEQMVQKDREPFIMKEHFWTQVLEARDKIQRNKREGIISKEQIIGNKSNHKGFEEEKRESHEGIVERPSAITGSSYDFDEKEISEMSERARLDHMMTPKLKGRLI